MGVLEQFAMSVLAAGGQVFVATGEAEVSRNDDFGGAGTSDGGDSDPQDKMGISKESDKVDPLPVIVELVVGENAFKIHAEAVAYSTREDGSINWAGYAGYTWQQIKREDATAGYGSLASYRTQSKAVKSGYSFTKSAAKHLTEVVKRGENAGQLSRPYMRSGLVIQEIMNAGKGVPDATYKGGINYQVPGVFRGSAGTWELGINPKTNVIYHFNFTN
jgi:hypothetical protein